MKFVEKKFFKICSLVSFIYFLLFFSLIAGQVNLSAHGGYTFETFSNQKSIAVFLSIFNTSYEDKVITSVSSSISKKAEFHSHSNENNIIKMKKVDKILVKAKDSFFFQPGKYHIMIFSLKKELKDGDEFDVKLFLDDGSSINSKVKVLNHKLRNKNHM